MDWINLIISLISGAVGGNAAGALMKDKSLGTLWNSVAGVLGGGGIGALLQSLGVLGSGAGGGLDITSIIGNIAGGGVGGGILMAIISFIKSAMNAPKK